MSFQADELLLDYQKQWLADDAQFKAFEKSRRVGVSWAESGDASLYAASQNGGNYWYLGSGKDMAEAFIQDTVFWSSEVYSLAVGEITEDVFEDEGKDILRFSVRYASGFKVSALSSRPANLRSKGRPGDRFCFDEAAFHPDFPGLLKAAVALLMWGCKIRVISTHNGDTNPFNELIKEMRAGKRPGTVHWVDFKTAVAQGLYKRILQVLAARARPEERFQYTWTQQRENEWVAEMYAFYGDNAGEELDVVPSAGIGVWLAQVLIERCMVESQRIERTWNP